MILVIAEKPSVAQTTPPPRGPGKGKKRQILTGSGYLVSWCVEHLVGLSAAAAYGEQYKKWQATTAYRFCRRNGNTPLLLTRKSNSKPQKNLCTEQTFPKVGTPATQGARENSFSALSVLTR